MERPGVDRTPQIAIIAALPIEYSALELMVDDVQPTTVDGDRGSYRVGRMPSSRAELPHDVVITQLVQDGTRNAAATSADLIRSFPTVRCLVLSGIAGGIPAPDDPDKHVRLGDVVVATDGIVDYDHVRTTDGRDEPRRALDGLSRDLLRADRELESGEYHHRRPWDDTLRNPPALFDRPPPETDVLMVDGERAAHPPGRGAGRLLVHRGAIASGDRLLRDAKRRDQLAERFKVLAVEMEASGLAVAAALKARQWFVVRGVADYCDDNTKNDIWHPYASLAAAAYTRALLGVCQPFADPRVASPDMTSPPALSLPALDAIVNDLLEIDEIRDDGERRAILAAMPTSLTSAIPHQARPRLHVIEIVRCCAGHHGGREHLLHALQIVIPRQSVALRRAIHTIELWWPG